MLANTVIRFHVLIDHNQPNGVSSQSFASLVVLCPRLQELDISMFGGGVSDVDIIGPSVQGRIVGSSFDNEVLSTLQAGLAVTCLRYSNWTDDTSTLSQLLRLWPTLKSRDQGYGINRYSFPSFRTAPMRSE